METLEFMGPDGSEISGSLEVIGGYCAGAFHPDETGAIDFEPSGGTDVDWNGQRTVEIDSVSVFLCDGGEFLQHHLIPQDADPLPATVVRLMLEEVSIGRAYEALRLAAIETNNIPIGRIGFSALAAVATAMAQLQFEYVTARDNAASAKAIALNQPQEA